MTSKNPPGWHRGALTHSQQWWRKCQCLCSTTSSMCRTPNDIELGGVHTLPTRQVLSCPAPVCPNSSERFPAQSYMVPSICTAIVLFIPKRQLDQSRTPAHVWWENCHSPDRSDSVEDSELRKMRNLQCSLHHRSASERSAEQLLWEGGKAPIQWKVSKISLTSSKNSAALWQVLVPTSLRICLAWPTTTPTINKNCLRGGDRKSVV